MSNVLWIKASPRTERSHSSAVAGAFLEAYRQGHPDDEVREWNLFEDDLPTFDGLAVQAKYTILHGKEHTAEELEAWRAVEAVIERVKWADKLVLSVPMWNFGIPYRLKQLLDIIVQPTYTFSYTPEDGYTGLLTGRKALVVYARGGAYAEGTGAEAYDLQKPYLDNILGFMGITDVTSILVEPTLMGGPEAADAAREDARAKARELAATF
jgi:FMN-dependent NADH-azoreductase